MRLAALLFACCAALAAQDPGEDPQLVWEGDVDGLTLLRIHGNRIDLDPVRGLPVQRQRFRFDERLPQSRQNVRLEVVEGRGRVRIVEQPRADNNYTLAVEIDDRQGGRSFYSLAFFWEARQRGGFRDPEERPQRRGRMESVWWNGRVDGEAIVNCRAGVCEPEAVRGGPVMRDRYKFSRPLPDRSVTVTLDETDGRGDIRLLEQPRDSNDYSARVAIRDPQGGSGEYTFTLVWMPPARDDRGFDFARRGMVWHGRVDGRVRVTLSNGIASTEVLSGMPVSGERSQFFRRLPDRDNPNVTVKKLHGRGRVEIVEYPSSRNGYRVVFEIDDRSGGSSEYEVEVGW